MCLGFETDISLFLQVDFDRTKHLSDKNIRRRRIERQRLMQIEHEKEQQVIREMKEEERKKEEERLK